MAYIEFITQVHSSTKRDYLGRVNAHDKAKCAEIAGTFGEQYWDGPRHLGYGGYRYDGRWRAVAQALADHYKLAPGMRVLDVGCGKAFLLYELSQVVPGLVVAGVDVSAYAVANAKEEVRPFLSVNRAESLPFRDNEFDLVISLNTLHNLPNYALHSALKEIQRVGKASKYIVIESFRNEWEKVNLLYWQLTCRAFYDPKEWEWMFAQAGYTGDYGCIYFE